MQIMDDIMDLEQDLKNGHYSYPTLGFEKELSRRPPGEAAALITSDREHLKRIRGICQALLAGARKRGIQLQADLFGYWGELLQTRLDDFFSEMLYDN